MYNWCIHDDTCISEANILFRTQKPTPSSASLFTGGCSIDFHRIYKNHRGY